MAGESPQPPPTVVTLQSSIKECNRRISCYSDHISEDFRSGIATGGALQMLKVDVDGTNVVGSIHLIVAFLFVVAKYSRSDVTSHPKLSCCANYSSVSMLPWAMFKITRLDPTSRWTEGPLSVAVSRTIDHINIRPDP